VRSLLVAAALMTAILGATGVAAAAISPGSKPKSVVLLRPGFTTPYWVQVSLRRNGVVLDGRHQTVLSARCTGGSGPRRRKDKFGWLYHRFTCAVATPSDPLAHAKVRWWSDNTYRYDFFGCRPGRGCA
jgi:hypothetical protein